jgi:hypothetical protein
MAGEERPLKPYDALVGKHCGTCAKFHVPVERPQAHIGFCVAHPAQVQSHYALLPSIQHALAKPGTPPPMQSKLLQVQAMIPSLGEEDGCWEHVPRKD